MSAVILLLGFSQNENIGQVYSVLVHYRDTLGSILTRSV